MSVLSRKTEVICSLVEKKVFDWPFNFWFRKTTCYSVCFIFTGAQGNLMHHLFVFLR